MEEYMENKPIKVECKLNIHGTQDVDEKVKKDLLIPDPDDTRAKAILTDVLTSSEEDEEDRSETSEKGPDDNQ